MSATATWIPENRFVVRAGFLRDVLDSIERIGQPVLPARGAVRTALPSRAHILADEALRHYTRMDFFELAVDRPTAWAWRPAPAGKPREKNATAYWPWIAARIALKPHGPDFSWPPRTAAKKPMPFPLRSRLLPVDMFSLRLRLRKRQLAAQAMPKKAARMKTILASPAARMAGAPSRRRAQAGTAVHSDSGWGWLSVFLVSALILWWNTNHIIVRYSEEASFRGGLQQTLDHIAPGLDTVLEREGLVATAPALDPANDTLSLGLLQEQAKKLRPVITAPPTVSPQEEAVAPDANFMRAASFTCTLKHIPCEMLLAIAKLESGLGAHTINEKSSARGAMQVVSGEFLRMVQQYGANNTGNIAAYLASLDPASIEAIRLRGDLATLKAALIDMNGDRYKKTHALPAALEKEVLQLNNDPVVQLVFVADSLLEHDRWLASRGFSPENRFRYAYFVYLEGPLAAQAALAAYADPKKRDRPVAPILAELYARTYYGDTGKRHASEYGKHFATKVLVDNGQNSGTTVRQFVEMRVTPFIQLVRAYHAMMPHQSARAEERPKSPAARSG